MSHSDVSSWWCAVYDPASASYYYYHCETLEVSWDMPAGFDMTAARKRERDAAGLGLADAPSGLAMLLSTRKLQAAFRARRDRRVAEEMRRHAEAAQNGWSAVWDSASGKYYYWNLETYETTFDRPTGFDLARAKRSNREAAGLSLTDAKGGLALLIATRKIQAAYRAKQARYRIRSKRAERTISDINDLDADVVWIKVMDPSSGYPYWYHKDTHEVTWEQPMQNPPEVDYGTNVEYKERILSNAVPDDYCFQPRRAALPFVADFLNKDDFPLKLLTKVDLFGKLLPIAKASRKALRRDSHGTAVDFGPLISCGTLLALRIRGAEECEMTAPALDALRILLGHPKPVPDLSNLSEKKLSKGLKTYRGNRRWLQKHRRGLLSKMCDFEFLRTAEGKLGKAKDSISGLLEPDHIALVREYSTSGAALFEWLRVIFAEFRHRENVSGEEKIEENVNGCEVEVIDAVKSIIFKVCQLNVLAEVKDTMEDILSELST